MSKSKHKVTRNYIKTSDQPGNSNWYAADLMTAQDNETLLHGLDGYIEFQNKHASNAGEVEYIFEVCSASASTPSEISAVTTETDTLGRRTIIAAQNVLRNSGIPGSVWHIPISHHAMRVIERGQTVKLWWRCANETCLMNCSIIASFSER